MNCWNCKTPAYADNPIGKEGLCAQCHVEARSTLRKKLDNFLGDPSNFTCDEWVILYNLKEDILTSW